MEPDKKYNINVKIDIFLFNLMLVALEIMGIKRAFKYSCRTLRFYTTDSNIFLCITSTIMMITALVCIIKKCDIPRHILILKYFSVCCITMTFIVVIAVLLPGKVSDGYGPHIMYKGAQIYHHTVCPIMAIIAFIFIEKKDKFDKLFIRAAYIPTAIYGVVIVILNLKGIVYGPYPFLRITTQPVYKSIFWFFVMIIVARSINSVMYLVRHPIKNPERITKFVCKYAIIFARKFREFYED